MWLQHLTVIKQECCRNCSSFLPLLPLPFSPQLQIWDTSGQECYRTITQSYYQNADAIVLVYDIGLPDSFQNLPEWLSEVEKYAESNVQKILIGNKSDRPDREITSELGRRFSHKNDMPFLETSVKNSENIDELFLQLVTTLRDAHVGKKLRPQHGSAGVSRVWPTKHSVADAETDTGREGRVRGGCC